MFPLTWFCICEAGIIPGPASEGVLRVNEVRHVELEERGRTHKNDTARHRMGAPPPPRAGTVCWVTAGPGASEALGKADGATEDGGEGRGAPSQPASQWNTGQGRPRHQPGQARRAAGGGQTEPCPLAVSSGATSPAPGAAPLWVCTVGSITVPPFQLHSSPYCYYDKSQHR